MHLQQQRLNSSGKFRDKIMYMVWRQRTTHTLHPLTPIDNIHKINNLKFLRGLSRLIFFLNARFVSVNGVFVVECYILSAYTLYIILWI